MPNHVHGIIVITDIRRGTVPVPGVDGQTTQQDVDVDSLNLGGETPPLRPPTLGQVVAYFKYQSTKELNLLNETGAITKFWQRNYYEHIIRNEQEMQKIWDYIESNPVNWADDDENPMNALR